MCMSRARAAGNTPPATILLAGPVDADARWSYSLLGRRGCGEPAEPGGGWSEAFSGLIGVSSSGCRCVERTPRRMDRPVVAEMALLASVAGIGVGMLLDATW